MHLSSGISFDPSRTLWTLTTTHSTYALGVTPEGMLLHMYWGPQLLSPGDLDAAHLPPERSSQEPGLSLATEEYPASGGLRFSEMTIKAIFADGTRDLDIRWANARISSEKELPELHLELRDSVYPLTVTLHYRLDIANDLIIRSATLTNTGEEDITLERVYSAAWHLPSCHEKRTLMTLAGDWMGETRVQKQPLVAGTALQESRRGISGVSAYPWFGIITHEQGEIYFGTLAWSGNWITRTSTTITGTTAIVGGIHDHDFLWCLTGGTSFTTPEFVAGFAVDGINGARQRLHRYTREHVLPHLQRNEPRPVLYNSWEATAFEVTEAGQMALAEQAACLGVELFVVDDGWFHGRTHDRAGLGDWFPDQDKFPRGLGPLARHVQELSMDFGLWVEPEMVNPESDLYRAHPDWVYHFPSRSRSLSRHQLVLNLARDDVQAYLLAALDQLLTDYPIRFLKWDMNRPIAEAGWPAYHTANGEAREVWVRHTQGVWNLLDQLRASYPTLSIESCASGGGRADLGILRRADQVWVSDNTYPDARLLIQEGLAHVLPARVMGAWVTDASVGASRASIPLAYRFHISMLGALGIGGNLLEWTDEEMTEATYWISRYKEIRPLVQDGTQYWLVSPHATDGQAAAIIYVADDARTAVLFGFRRVNAFADSFPLVRLQGLHAETHYRLECDSEPTRVFSGAALMGRGIELPLHRDSYASCLLRLYCETVS